MDVCFDLTHCGPPTEEIIKIWIFLWIRHVFTMMAYGHIKGQGVLGMVTRVVEIETLGPRGGRTDFSKFYYQRFRSNNIGLCMRCFVWLLKIFTGGIFTYGCLI